jgi:nitrogen regulatory protein P-II 1
LIFCPAACEKLMADNSGVAMLKKIEAIIREDKFNDVKEALKEIGILGLNAFEIRGQGRQGGISLVGRSGSYRVDMLTKIQINIVLSEHNLEETIEAILNSAYTGQAGDGLIFVYPVEEVIRIRTRERGHEAVMYPGDIDERKKRTTA